MTATCAWCDAPRQPGPVCPDCGADYAKAEAIRRTGRAIPAVDPVAGSTDTTAIEKHPGIIPVRDPAFEWKLCLFALPGMMLVALLVQVTGFLAGMQRIFFGMPVHEFGHAVTGWLCGFNAIPTLWKTVIPADRGYLSSLFVIAGLTAIARYGLKRKQSAWLLGVAGVLIIQGYCTLAISLSKADMLIIMGGDAMGMILTTMLMSLFYVGKNTQLYKGSLRWGFLVIGAAAFFDMFTPWWNKDLTAIGYGLTGGEPTDAWKLINIHLWTPDALMNSQITLGVACLVILAGVYFLGLKQARGWVTEKEKCERLERLRGD